MQLYAAGLKEDTFPCGPSKGMFKWQVMIYSA
jgi:hypothetical protein